MHPRGSASKGHVPKVTFRVLPTSESGGRLPRTQGRLADKTRLFIPQTGKRTPGVGVTVTLAAVSGLFG